MKILGRYKGRVYASFRIEYDALLGLEVSCLWTEPYSSEEGESRFFVNVQSGCYKFHIMTTNGEYLSKEQADEIVKQITMNDIVSLDDNNMAFTFAYDTTPEEYYVRNALDDDYTEIPLVVI